MASHRHEDPPGTDDSDPAAYWEARYADSGPLWSGRVNAAFAAIVADLPPGRSLDLGCGEGGDVVWLAEQGWAASGVDLSPTAVQRGLDAATARGLPTGDAPGEVRLAAADVSTWIGEAAQRGERFDLVSASFLQSPVDLDREAVLASALQLVAPGGRLVIISHAEAPPWAESHMAHHVFPAPEDDLAALGLDDNRDDSEGAWEVLTAERRARPVTAPDGTAGSIDDTLVVVRRRP